MKPHTKHTKLIYFILLLLSMSLITSACTAVFRAFDAPLTSANDALIGDPERGERIFKVGINESPPCSSCHQASENSYSLGLAPTMIGISERASTRIEGVSAEEYIKNSILEPEKFVVPGFSVEMYKDYREFFTEQDIADLIAFLMGL